ncbi:MAG: MauE/DoxX family redox-associated membrane protein [Streptosporangiaceae bacterium]|jgi:uncharacterized membrane protein YphA (DoxX/SURF4 family)
MIFASAGYLVLIVVLAFSGIGKIRHLSVFGGQVADYQLIPEKLTRPAATAVAVTETGCAVLLALPWTRRAGAVLAVALFALFLTAMSLAWSRGRRVACGCFGGTGDLDTVGPPTIVRTALLCAIAVGALLAPPGPSLPVRCLLGFLMLVLVFLLAETTRLLTGWRPEPAGSRG